MEIQKFWTKPKIIFLISLFVLAVLIVAIVLIHRANLRKKYIALENKINNSVVSNYLKIEKIELKDDEYKKISLDALYTSTALSGKNDGACEGYVIAEKGNTKEGIVSKPYLKCGNIYTTEGYGSTSTKSENKTIAQSDNDTEAPVLKLNGSDPMTIELNEKFNDPSVVAIDNVDKNVKVKVTGKVDITKEGEYELTYTATDSAGNKSSITRKVIVKKGAGKTADTTPPTITFTNESTYQNVCIGEKVDVSKTGVYGYIASDDVDGILTDKVKIEGNTGVATSAGEFTLTYKVKDSAGNEGMVTRKYTVTDCSAPVQPDNPPETPPDTPPEPWNPPDNPDDGGGGGGGSNPNPSANVQPTGIYVPDDTIYVGVNKDVYINASVEPSNASDQTLRYKATNTNVATVDENGKVHGVRKGETSVTIKTINNKERGVYIVVE